MAWSLQLLALLMAAYLFAASLVLALSSTVLTGGPVAQQKPARAEAKPEVTELPLELIANRPLVRLKVNGQGPFAFLIDPQATRLTVDQRLVETLKETLKLKPVTREGSQTIDLEIASGAAKIAVTATVVADVSALLPELAPPVPVRGVINLGLWKDQLVTLDYPRFRVLIEAGELPDPNDKDVFALTGESNELLVPLRIDEESLRCRVDPMLPRGLLVPSRLLESVPVNGKSADGGFAGTRSLNGPVREAIVSVPVSLAVFEFDHRTVLFGDISNDAVAGGAFLSGFALTYDIAHQRARLARPPAGILGATK